MGAISPFKGVLTERDRGGHGLVEMPEITKDVQVNARHYHKLAGFETREDMAKSLERARP